MNIDKYLQRISFRETPNTDLATLTALQRAHACAVPFENLDVQLGQSLTTDAEDAYTKIVERGRGGWCYEQNGVFALALEHLGFDVTRVAAAVMRQERGDVATANHLCLLVSLPGDATRYLVDVGFGGSLFAPIELRQADYTHPPYRLGLEYLDDGYWRFWEDSGNGRFGFDFLPEAGDETAMSRKCEFLQTDPSSGFVQNLVAQRRLPEQHKALRGRVLTTIADSGTTTTTLQSAAELMAVLAAEFDLHVPEAADLWPAIVSRHEALGLPD